MPEHTAIYTAIRTEPDAPDEVKLGAVSMASVVLDKHITDPVAREAWLLIRDAAVCPWIRAVGESKAQEEGDGDPPSSRTPNLDELRRRAGASGKVDAPTRETVTMGATLSLAASRDVIKIGRLNTSHVVFDHDSVARMHATLERQPDGRSWMVIDLGSAAGTEVHRPDGSVDRVRMNAPVGVGDILHFGECTLELVR